MKKWFLVLLILCASLTSISQDFSNKGKDFWVAYTGHIDATSSRMALYITSDQDAIVTVEVNGVASAPVTAYANKVTTIQITSTTTPSNLLAYNAQSEGIGTKKGIHITSTHNVAVYAHILNAARSGSTLVIPTAVLGREYYAASYQTVGSGAGNYSEFAVVATEDSTTVDIVPTQPDISNKRAANVAFQVKLNKGDVYQYQSINDLSGSYIKSVASSTVSCKPIAVFSGSTRTFMGCPNASSGDNLYQQMFPFSSWGKIYYTAPFKNKSYDIFRIFVQDPSEIVYVDGVALNQSSIISNRYYDLSTSGNNKAQVISSNKPICVLQYITAQNCDNVPSDPEMIILNSIEQTLSDITVMSARKDLTPPNTQIDNHYLNIIFKTSTFNSLKIDGAKPIAVPTAIGSTGYSYIQEDVTSSTNVNPYHRIVSDSGFMCIAYGFGAVESYGYNAGTNVKDLYQYITLRSQYASVNFPATCKGTPVNLSITLPYLPTSLVWDFANNAGVSPNINVINNAPVPDSVFVRDGRTVNVFKLPGLYNFTVKGTVPIKVIANNPSPDGCSGLQEINYDVLVYDAPKANFTITQTGCVTDDVKFFDATIASGRPTVKWNWDFGDATVDRVKDPVKRYSNAAPGSFAVKMISINDIGCIADTTIPIAISTVPKAQFLMTDTICTNKVIELTDSSSNEVGTIVKWYWDYGDGVFDTLQTKSNRSHSYNLSGSKTVTLKVVTNTGCKSLVASKNIVIHPNPIAGFISPEVCLSDSYADFKDTSSIATSTIVSWLWNFGDPVSGSLNVSSLQNPKHSYSVVGPYTVNLTVTGSGGCASTISQDFIVNASNPKADFTVGNSVTLCANDSVSITNISAVFPGSVTKVEIYWDNIGAPNLFELDDLPFLGKIYKHLYPNFQTPLTKNFIIRLRAYSGTICVEDKLQTITINASPKVSFGSLSPLCLDALPYQIIEASETAGMPGTFKYTGLGVSSTGIFSPTIAGAGNHRILYTYTSSAGGCIDTASQLITVMAPPIADFTYDQPACETKNIFFNSTSSTLVGQLTQFIWDFGDGLAAVIKNTHQSFSHVYSKAGDYSVALKVSTSNGCVSSLKQLKVSVRPLPHPNFSVPATACLPNASVLFTNQTTIEDGTENAITYNWVFGDPMSGVNNISIANSPTHVYSSIGAYNIYLKATSGYGCVSDTTILFNAIHSQPKAIIGTDFPEVCLGNKVVFSSMLSGIDTVATAWNWSFGDGQSDLTRSPEHLYKTASTFDVSLSIKNNFGCMSDTVKKIFTVNPNPTVDIGPDRVVLEGGSVVLSSLVTGTELEYLWSPASYLNSVTNPSATVVNPLTDIGYTLTITAKGGCKSSDSLFIKILSAIKVPNLFSPNGDGINDRWLIKYLDSYPDCSLQVFTRSGQLVYETKKYTDASAWDGTLKGKQLPFDTYYYILQPGSGRKPITGYVTILK